MDLSTVPNIDTMPSQPASRLRAPESGNWSAPRMVSRVRTVAFHGIEVMPIFVQVQATSGMPSFTNVG